MGISRSFPSWGPNLLFAVVGLMDPKRPPSAGPDKKPHRRGSRSGHQSGACSKGHFSLCVSEKGSTFECTVDSKEASPLSVACDVQERGCDATPFASALQMLAGHTIELCA